MIKLTSEDEWHDSCPPKLKDALHKDMLTFIWLKGILFQVEQEKVKHIHEW